MNNIRSRSPARWRRDITITQEYVCQIHSRRHINVCALGGRVSLEAISIKEGQAVKDGRSDVRDRASSLQGEAGRRVAERELAQLETELHQEVGRQTRCLSRRK